MHNFSLTTEETALIIKALSAIAPTGGGSPQFHLASRLSTLSGVEVDPRAVGLAQLTAYDEILEGFSLNQGDNPTAPTSQELRQLAGI